MIRGTPNAGVIGAPGGIRVIGERPKPGDNVPSGSDSEDDAADFKTLLDCEKRIGIQVNQHSETTQNIAMKDSVFMQQNVERQEHNTVNQVQTGVSAAEVAGLQQQAEAFARGREGTVRANAEVLHQQSMSAAQGQAELAYQQRLTELDRAHQQETENSKARLGTQRS